MARARAAGRLVGFGILASLALFGCGGDSGGGSNGDPAATRMSCDAYCIAYAAASCASPMFTSMAECGMVECDPLSAVPAGCQATVKAYYDCRKAEADICNDVGCDSQFAAIANCH